MSRPNSESGVPVWGHVNVGTLFWNREQQRNPSESVSIKREH